jgi:signal transduction histidine kinase
MRIDSGPSSSLSIATLDALAHELKQPVTAILTNAQVGLAIRAQGPSQEVLEILEDIEHEARRAGAIIERLRSLLQGHDTRPETPDQAD